MGPTGIEPADTRFRKRELLEDSYPHDGSLPNRVSRNADKENLPRQSHTHEAAGMLRASDWRRKSRNTSATTKYPKAKNEDSGHGGEQELALGEGHRGTSWNRPYPPRPPNRRLRSSPVELTIPRSAVSIETRPQCGVRPLHYSAGSKASQRRRARSSPSVFRKRVIRPS